MTLSSVRSRRVSPLALQAGVGVSVRLIFECGVLLIHLLFALWIRTVAWPEVTTPAYLWSRGLLLYRDIKFLHTPGAMGLLALFFRVFGPETWVVRAFAIAGPLIAHADILLSTRRLSIPRRVLISAFYLVSLFVSDGNAVWPTVLMAALALPIARALSGERFRSAGLIIGAAILLKQTAAYLLVLAVIVLLVRRRWNAAASLVVFASIPYAAALAAFSLAGAGVEMLRWTLVVPFQVQEVTFAPSLLTIGMMAASFLPATVACAMEREKRSSSACWLLLVALGLTLLSYPNFMLLQTIAAFAPLAVGAARALELADRRLSAALAGLLLALVISRAVVLAASATFDGRVLFWNEDPAFNALIARLRRLPPETRLHSELWGNVLPRSKLLPPGNIWVHPWLRWYHGVENSRERVLAAARNPGTVWVGYRSDFSTGERIGPYAIWRVGEAPAPGRRKNE